MCIRKKTIYIVHDLSVTAPYMHRTLSDYGRTSVGLDTDLSRTRVGGDVAPLGCQNYVLCTETVIIKMVKMRFCMFFSDKAPF